MSRFEQLVLDRFGSGSVGGVGLDFAFPALITLAF